MSSWRDGASGILQGSALGLVLLNIFVQDWANGAECVLMALAGDTMGGACSTLDRVRIQTNPDSLEKGPEFNKMNFNKVQVLHLGRK